MFKRDGVNVHTDIPVTLAQAVLGGTVKVPTLSGAEVEIKVPPGTQPEEKRVLRNQGVSAVGQPGTKGHHYIHFKVEIPTYVVPQSHDCCLIFLYCLMSGTVVRSHVSALSTTSKQQQTDAEAEGADGGVAKGGGAERRHRRQAEGLLQVLKSGIGRPLPPSCQSSFLFFHLFIHTASSRHSSCRLSYLFLHTITL